MKGLLIATSTLLAGLLMTLSTACDSTPPSPSPTPPNPTTDEPVSTPVDTETPVPDRQKDADEEADTLRRAQAELDRRRARWTSNRADDYSFVFTDVCFSCSEGPVTIRVENGVVASVKYVESGKAPEHDYSKVTIDRLFDVIQKAIDGKASEIKATYDPEIGYPTDVRIDYDPSWTDGANLFFVSGYSSGGQR